MRIQLKIIGNELYQHLSTELKKADSLFPQTFRQDTLEWELLPLSATCKSEDFLGNSNVPSVVIAEINDSEWIKKIQTMEQNTLLASKKHSESSMILPIILVLRSAKLLDDTTDFGESICDWTFAPVMVPDLVRRIFVSLKRKNVLRTRQQFGGITLLPETHDIVFEDRTAHLTPSEYTLAELFLTHMGSIIPSKDLVSLFEQKGKSTKPNNIRVAIFQLRLKLEILTKCALILTSTYNQGYCLRQKSKAGELANMHSDGYGPSQKMAFGNYAATVLN